MSFAVAVILSLIYLLCLLLHLGFSQLAFDTAETGTASNFSRDIFGHEPIGDMIYIK